MTLSCTRRLAPFSLENLCRRRRYSCLGPSARSSSTTPIRTVRRATPILDVVDLRDVVDLTVIPQSFDVQNQQPRNVLVDDGYSSF